MTPPFQLNKDRLVHNEDIKIIPPFFNKSGVFYFTYIYHYMKYIIKESQYMSLLENLNKNKKFLTNMIYLNCVFF